MDFTTVKENLEKRNFVVKTFATSAEAVAYLDKEIDGVSVGAGGSKTIGDIGLLDALCSHNEVYSHALVTDGDPAKMVEMRTKAAMCDVYISSVNGVAETGEMINIDGHGNRVAATIWGHERVYFVVGRNKIAPDYEAAMFRARNVASPLNAKRLNRKTPCAVNGDKCYDCKSPERICNVFVTFENKPSSGAYEVILIDEDLGM